MKEWRQAWQLSKIELNRQVLWIVLSALFFIMMAFFLGIGFTYYMDENPMLKENNPGLYDIAFIFLFWMVPAWMRAKEFRYQSLSSYFWGSPYFIKLMQLPIPEKVIIKHRLLTYMALSGPIHILFLLLFYLFSGWVGEFIHPVQFIAFSIIWLSFSVYAGYVFPASDVGDRVGPVKLVFLYIVFGLLGLGTYIFIEHFTSHSLVAWTMVFADRWPVLSSVISILLAYLGLRTYMYYMRKKMNKTDYLYG